MMGTEAMELETDIRQVYADDPSRSLPRPSTLVPLLRPRQTSRSAQRARVCGGQRERAQFLQV